MGQRRCGQCNALFNSTKNQVYCSGPCANQGNRDRQRARDTKRVRIRLTCKHCGLYRDYAWGVCFRCHKLPEVQAAYAPKSTEPTEEELEAIIAEQMRCLPDWWPREGELDVEE